MNDATILRLFISQAFLCYYFLMLIPLRKPVKRNVLIVVVAAIIITSMNALLILAYGLVSFYIRFFFVTLILPYVALFSYLAVYKGAKLVFAILSVEVVGNLAIINGLFASYLIYEKNNPLTDTIARIITFVLFLPIVIKLIRKPYLKMAKTLNKGWWVLNASLILSYLLAYYLLFVPSTIFERPEQFVHAYLSIILSLIIYAIIFFLFIEIQSKTDAERDKQLLAVQVTSLAAQSAAISASEEKMNILRHDMRHHLFIVSEQISQGNIEQAKIFLHNFETQLAETRIPIYCKNIVINAALAYYFGYAEKNNIKIDANLNIPEVLIINPAELAIVFANAIENAIHACQAIKDVSLRKITLVCQYVKDSLVLIISNPSYEDVSFDSSGIPVSLENNHGVGVLSMVAFAKKNNAILEFTHENSVFTMRLLINASDN